MILHDAIKTIQNRVFVFFFKKEQKTCPAKNTIVNIFLHRDLFQREIDKQPYEFFDEANQLETRSDL